MNNGTSREARSNRPREITDESFDKDVLRAEVPVLVDFWADWCGPCKAIAPIVTSLAELYGDRVRIAKLNVDDNPEATARFGVRSIPTLVMFAGGEARETVVGLQTKAALEVLVERYAA